MCAYREVYIYVLLLLLKDKLVPDNLIYIFVYIGCVLRICFHHSSERRMKAFRSVLGAALCSNRRELHCRASANDWGTAMRTRSKCNVRRFVCRHRSSRSQEKSNKSVRKQKQKMKHLESCVEDTVKGKTMTAAVQHASIPEEMNNKFRREKNRCTIPMDKYEEGVREEGIFAADSTRIGSVPAALPTVSFTSGNSLPRSLSPTTTGSAALCLETKTFSVKERMQGSVRSFTLPSSLEMPGMREKETKQNLTPSTREISFRPSEEDYRALLLDVLLSRRETLLPIVSVIREERKALIAQVNILNKKVKELEHVRREVREMLEAYVRQGNNTSSKISSSVGHLSSPMKIQNSLTQESSSIPLCSSQPCESEEHGNRASSCTSLRSLFDPNESKASLKVESALLPHKMDRESKGSSSDFIVTASDQGAIVQKEKLKSRTSKVRCGDFLLNSLSDGEEIQF